MEQEYQKRIDAVKRYLSGEKPVDIYKLLEKPKQWLWFWLNLYDPNDENSPSRVTRTRRFPDEASAPDGAIEKTQLAIRYEELLAFVIAAL